jgi:hypothetical protein
MGPPFLLHKILPRLKNQIKTQGAKNSGKPYGYTIFCPG